MYSPAVVLKAMKAGYRIVIDGSPDICMDGEGRVCYVLHAGQCGGAMSESLAVASDISLNDFISICNSFSAERMGALVSSLSLTKCIKRSSTR